MKLPKIAISTGDPNGIGPEISIKVALDKEILSICEPILVGNKETLSKTFNLLNIKNKMPNIVDTKTNSTKIEFGKITAIAGKESILAVDTAVNLVMNNQADAICTAPICKEAVNLAGYSNFTGHTEYIAKKDGMPEIALALYKKDIVIAHVTCHLSVKEAIENINQQRIIFVAKLLKNFYKTLKIDCKMAIGGLNPHAGEGGLLGKEEIEIINPAVKHLKEIGIDVTGSIPPDVVFPSLFSGRFNSVVAMLHDHGHVAFKTSSFKFNENGGGSTSGVNITLGLSFIRTSVDHGTAFDIAGRNLGDTGSLKDAIKLACKLANGKN